MKLSHHPNPAIVAMATAKLHTILQARSNEDLHELGFLMFSINKALNTAIESELTNKTSFKHFRVVVINCRYNICFVCILNFRFVFLLTFSW